MDKRVRSVHKNNIFSVDQIFTNGSVMPRAYRFINLQRLLVFSTQGHMQLNPCSFPRKPVFSTVIVVESMSSNSLGNQIFGAILYCICGQGDEQVP